MTKVRVPGDPWYTALYRDPYRLWWAPPLFIFAFLLLLRVTFFDDDWVESLILAAVPAAAYAIFVGLRHRSRVRP